MMLEAFAGLVSVILVILACFMEWIEEPKSANSLIKASLFFHLIYLYGQPA